VAVVVSFLTPTKRSGGLHPVFPRQQVLSTGAQDRATRLSSHKMPLGANDKCPRGNRNRDDFALQVQGNHGRVQRPLATPNGPCIVTASSAFHSPYCKGTGVGPPCPRHAMPMASSALYMGVTQAQPPVEVGVSGCPGALLPPQSSQRDSDGVYTLCSRDGGVWCSIGCPSAI
jgi:hypothetical protein